MASKIFVDNDNFVALPSKDTTNNNTFSDVIGNKTDVAASNSDVVSIVGLLRYIIANLSSDTDIAALIGALDTAVATGAVSNNKTIMAYTKQLVTALNVVKGDLDDGGRLDLLIDAIKAKTDNLPADTAITLSTIETKIDTIDNLVDTEVSAIKTVVDLIWNKVNV